MHELSPGNQNPGRKEFTSNRIMRNTILAQQIKKLVNFQCQLCETRIQLKDGNFYCEAHHIKPLGKPHNGPDVKENILVVCPNCHIKCDNAVLKLNLNEIKNNVQGISIEFIKHHNERFHL